MLLTDFFNSHILDTLLKLLTLTSECCCQATFPTKKTKKKLADHELTMTLRSEAVANVCEKTKTFVKIYSELRLFLEERKFLNADLLLNNILKCKHKEILSRASRTEGGKYTTSYNISSIDIFLWNGELNMTASATSVWTLTQPWK